MYKYEEIIKVHLELTQRCQASCPMCPRTNNPLISNAELSIQDIHNIFPEKFIHQLKHLTLCGNYGEPIIAKDFIEIVDYFRKTNSNMCIGINTNAGARNSDFWYQLAKIFRDSSCYVVFGIDGLQDTNHLYRVGVNWDKVISSAKTFIKYGGKARWDFIVFEHNEHQVEDARKLSKELGFEEFRLKKTYRFEKYKNINLNPPKNYFNDVAPVFSKSDTYFDSVEIDCLVNKSKEIYVSAQGLLFPCCWVGSKLYKDISKAEEPNLKINSIQEIMNTNYFYDLEEKWKLNTIKEGKPLVCAKFCGKNNNLFESQFT